MVRAGAFQGEEVTVDLQPAAVALEIRHHFADSPPERRLMVRMAEMAELMHDHVVEDIDRRQDQPPIEVDHASMGAAAPKPLLVFDAER